MTQAPTPGPLSAQQEEAIAFNLCSLHGFDPAFVTTQRDFAFAVIKEYERARPSLAPTAPVEASGSERERETIRELNCARSEIERLKKEIAALRPQPSGETRKGENDPVRRVLERICETQTRLYGKATALHLAMLDLCVTARAELAISRTRPAPVASGGQHSSGEMRVVPRKPTDRDVSEILYNINRKRRADDELSEADVREVMDNYFYNVGQPDPAPVPAQDDAKLRIAEEALEPFARAAGKLDRLWDEDDWRWNDSVRSNVTVRDIRRAAEALAALKSTAAQEGGES